MIQLWKELVDRVRRYPSPVLMTTLLGFSLSLPSALQAHVVCMKVDSLPEVREPNLLLDLTGAPKPVSDVFFQQTIRQLTRSTLLSIEKFDRSCHIAGCHMHVFRIHGGRATQILSFVGTGQIAVLTSQTEFEPEDLESTIRFAQLGGDYLRVDVYRSGSVFVRTLSKYATGLPPCS